MSISVLSYENDLDVRDSADKILVDMDKLGLRPLTLEEMTIVGINHLEFTENFGAEFVGLTPYPYEGKEVVPTLKSSLVPRGQRLEKHEFNYAWGPTCNFLCVRK